MDKRSYKSTYINRTFVGSIPVYIYEVENLVQHQGVWGSTMEEGGHYMVEIDASLKDEKRQAVLLHELIHVAEMEGGYSFRECEVQTVATLLAQMLGPFATAQIEGRVEMEPYELSLEGAVNTDDDFSYHVVPEKDEKPN